MLIILLLYVFLIWLLFSRLRLIRLGWVSGTIAALVGVAILATFLALFNYLTPSGRFVVVSRVIEVTPNVSGQITEIPVKPNVPVKAGAVLFQIDPVAVQVQGRAAARRAGAGQAAGKPAAEQLRSGRGHCRRPEPAARLQPEAARGHLLPRAWRKRSPSSASRIPRSRPRRSAPSSRPPRRCWPMPNWRWTPQINGINPTVAQIAAQLDDAQWQLEQTTIRAPADGVVTAHGARPSATGRCRPSRYCRSCSTPMSCWSACSRRTASTPIKPGAAGEAGLRQ